MGKLPIVLGAWAIGSCAPLQASLVLDDAWVGQSNRSASSGARKEVFGVVLPGQSIQCDFEFGNVKPSAGGTVDLPGLAYWSNNDITNLLFSGLPAWAETATEVGDVTPGVFAGAPPALPASTEADDAIAQTYGYSFWVSGDNKTGSDGEGVFQISVTSKGSTPFTSPMANDAYDGASDGVGQEHARQFILTPTLRGETVTFTNRGRVAAGLTLIDGAVGEAVP